MGKTTKKPHKMLEESEHDQQNWEPIIGDLIEEYENETSVSEAKIKKRISLGNANSRLPKKSSGDVNASSDENKETKAAGTQNTGKSDTTSRTSPTTWASSGPTKIVRYLAMYRFIIFGILVKVSSSTFKDEPYMFFWSGNRERRNSFPIH